MARINVEVVVVLQIYEGLGDSSNVGIGSTIARDPDAERMLQERGFRDIDCVNLCVAAPRDQMEEDDDSSGGASMLTYGVDGLVVEDTLVLTSLHDLYQVLQP